MLKLQGSRVSVTAIAERLCREESATYMAFYCLDKAPTRLYILSERPWANGEEAETIKMINEGGKLKEISQLNEDGG